MSSIENHLSYRSVDVSTIKELVRRWYPDRYQNRPRKAEGHRALADIRESIIELRHWRETVFDSELMTGFINRGGNPLSLVTVASLEDLGYAVDRESSEDFQLPPAATGASAARVPDPGARIALGDDILAEPIFTIDREGVIRRLEPR